MSQFKRTLFTVLPYSKNKTKPRNSLSDLLLSLEEGANEDNLHSFREYTV